MRYILALCALTFVLPAYADGYWTDKNGKILKTGKGLCLRAGKWSEKKADPACLDAMRKMTASTK